MKPWNHSWAALRLVGYRRCIWGCLHNAPSVEYENGHRQSLRWRGKRCSVMVSPEQIAKHGVTVCAKHLPMYLKWKAERGLQKAAMRAKYDPGPLPLDEVEAT